MIPRLWLRFLLTSGLAFFAISANSVASEATPTTWAITEAVGRGRAILSEDQSIPESVAASWTTFFNGISGDLETLATTTDASERQRLIQRLNRAGESAQSSGWQPAASVAIAIAEWTQPRLKLSDSFQKLRNGVQGASTTASSNAWLTFTQELERTLLAFDSAESVAERLTASKQLAIQHRALEETLRAHPWPPGVEVDDAMARLFGRPNLTATADLSIIRPFLDRDPVEAETIFFKGQTSYVTPGPRTGFGLLANPHGIEFYNSQYSYSTTPIAGFQEQVASRQEGRLIARFYQFSATAFNTNHVEVFALLTPEGLSLTPRNSPSITASFDAQPQPGHVPHIVGTSLSVAGFDRDRILEQVEEQALPELRQETAQGTDELSQYKAAEEAAKQNAELRQYLIGNQTLQFPTRELTILDGLALTQLQLASDPSRVSGSGLLRFLGSSDQMGSTFPKPEQLRVPGPGATIDLQLNSILNNAINSFYQRPEIAQIENLLVSLMPSETEGDAPIVNVERNASYAAFLKTAEQLKENPDALTIRLFKPAEPPQIVVDRNGDLTLVIRNLVIEVPAPDNFNLGGELFNRNAPSRDVKAIRFEFGRFELNTKLQVTPTKNGQSLSLKGGVSGFDLGGRETTVSTLGAEESDAQQLNLVYRSGALAIVIEQLRDRTFSEEISLSGQLPGLLINSISEINPTGWIRISVVRDASRPFGLLSQEESALTTLE